MAVDVREARVIFARASSVKSSTVRHKLELGAVVAVCWNCDRQRRSARPTEFMHPTCSNGHASITHGL
jgi:exosome complex RNA-binding protein Csl4